MGYFLLRTLRGRILISWASTKLRMRMWSAVWWSLHWSSWRATSWYIVVWSGRVFWISRITWSSEKIVSLLQDFSCFSIAAENLHCIRIKKPGVATMFSERDQNSRLFGFGKIEDNGVVDFFGSTIEVKLFICLKPGENVELVFLKTRFFFGFSEGGIKTFLTFFEMSFRKIPVLTSLIEKEIFNPFFGSAKNDKTSYSLFFDSPLLFIRIFKH